MKRILETIILLALVFFIFQVLSFLFKTGHRVEYVLSKDNKKFVITERYNRGYYHILIKDDNYKYNVFVINNYGKQKKIIKDIKYVSNDNMECIYPITSKRDLNISCSSHSTLYSYPMVSNDSLVTNFVKTLINEGYNNKYWTKSNPTKDNKVSYYKENLDDNLYLYIWKYNGFYTLKNKDISTIDMFNRDIYNNSLGMTYKDRYIIADYSKKFDFNNLMIFNMTNNTFRKVNFESKLSYNSYFNGIVDNKLYLVDPTNLVQYEVNLRNNSFKVVGNKELNGLYYNNGVWETINIYDFTKGKKLFNYNKIPDNLVNLNVITDKFNDISVYYYEKDGIFYEYDTISDISKQLFKLNGAKSIQIIKDKVYYIVDDTLYSYSDKTGIIPLFINNEFKFNSDNIYGIYLK